MSRFCSETSHSVRSASLLVLAVALRDYTWGVELYYNLAINKWLHLSPDLQLIQNERQADSVAVIPGIRLTIDF
jgi:carbohydrate-selective porin OprB